MTKIGKIKLLGAIGAGAKIEPMLIKKDARSDTVIFSVQQFESDYKHWIKEQNTQFERHGLWCDDVRMR